MHQMRCTLGPHTLCNEQQQATTYLIGASEWKDFIALETSLLEF